MTVPHYLLTIAGFIALSGLMLWFISTWLLGLKPCLPRAVLPRIWNYLRTGPVSLALALVIGIVEVAVSIGGVREAIRSEFGLPNENVWAYFTYAYIHADIRHLMDNAGPLLICGGIVEERIRGPWFLALVFLTVPLGGFLTTRIAPVFIDSPWADDLPSVGFSIVIFAVLILCSLSIISIVLKDRLYRLESASRKQQLAVVIVSSFLFISFYYGVQGIPGESILGHSVGMALGAVAGGIYWVVHRIRHQVAA